MAVWRKEINGTPYTDHDSRIYEIPNKFPARSWTIQIITLRNIERILEILLYNHKQRTKSVTMRQAASTTAHRYTRTEQSAKVSSTIITAYLNIEDGVYKALQL